MSWAEMGCSFRRAKAVMQGVEERAYTLGREC